MNSKLRVHPWDMCKISFAPGVLLWKEPLNTPSKKEILHMVVPHGMHKFPIYYYTLILHTMQSQAPSFFIGTQVSRLGLKPTLCWLETPDMQPRAWVESNVRICSAMKHHSLVHWWHLAISNKQILKIKFRKLGGNHNVFNKINKLVFDTFCSLPSR